jgi:hypothetical protein
VLICHGLDKLWKWNVGVFVYIVMNDGALMAVKKLYIRLCAARDIINVLYPGYNILYKSRLAIFYSATTFKPGHVCGVVACFSHFLYAIARQHASA